MTSKDALRPFVDWITVFPGRSRTTLNLIFIGQGFHYKFRHRTTTNIAKTDKDNFFHHCSSHL